MSWSHTQIPPGWITAEDLAAILGITSRAVRYRLKAGHYRATCFDRRWWWNGRGYYRRVWGIDWDAFVVTRAAELQALAEDAKALCYSPGEKADNWKRTGNHASRRPQPSPPSPKPRRKTPKPASSEASA